MSERPLYAPLQHAAPSAEPVDRLIALSEYPHSKLALIAFELERERDNLIGALRKEAAQLRQWAAQSRTGGWSTHQVDPMRRRADETDELLAKYAAKAPA